MLDRVVSESLETLYGAIDDGALSFKLGKPPFGDHEARHARKELEGYLDCGLLCRRFARLRCDSCQSSRVVAFSCKGRGFCPSCMGRRLCATAANLAESVMPPADLRHWVLTPPHAWRKRLSWDGELLGALTRIFTDAVHAFYAQTAAGESKAVIALRLKDPRALHHAHRCDEAHSGGRRSVDAGISRKRKGTPRA